MPKTIVAPAKFTPTQRRAYDIAASDYYHEITKLYGTMLRIGDVCKYLNCCENTAREWLKSVPVQKIGKSKKYAAIDVARQLALNKQYATR